MGCGRTVEFVDSQREHGVQPVLEALMHTPAGIPPPTYYAARTRRESARAARDREPAEKIRRVHEDNDSVYGKEGLGLQTHTRWHERGAA